MSNKSVVNSISSNSCSLSNSDESIGPTRKKKPKNNKLKGGDRKIREAHVSKRCFERVLRRLNTNRPVINLKTETTEKANCNRFILAQINGTQSESISPESITRLMQEMRNCLQNKDYCNLAKLISVFTEMPLGKSRWYPTLLKYCLIVLLYDPLVQGTGSMDSFLKGVIGCRGDGDKKQFLKDISRLPDNIHVTKYDNLWEPYSMPNQLTRETLDQLCEALTKQIHIESDDAEAAEQNMDDGNDSDWESYDENESDSDCSANNETTEPEPVCDFNDVIQKLEKKFVK